MSEFENSQNRFNQENMLRAQHGQNKLLRQIEDDLRKEVELAKEAAIRAEKDAEFARHDALFSKVLAILSLIVSIVAVVIPVLTALLT